MLGIVRVAVPVFVRVTVCAPLDVPGVTLPKARLVGFSETVGDVAIPVPVMESADGAVPVIVRMADRAPGAVGLNVTLTVQEPLTAMVPLLTQVPPPALAKSPAFVPVIVKYGVPSVAEPVPLFVTVTVVTALVVPSIWLPKAIGLGDIESVVPNW